MWPTARRRLAGTGWERRARCPILASAPPKVRLYSSISADEKERPIPSDGHNLFLDFLDPSPALSRRPIPSNPIRHIAPTPHSSPVSVFGTPLPYPSLAQLGWHHPALDQHASLEHAFVPARLATAFPPKKPSHRGLCLYCAVVISRHPLHGPILGVQVSWLVTSQLGQVGICPRAFGVRFSDTSTHHRHLGHIPLAEAPARVSCLPLFRCISGGQEETRRR